MYSITIFCIILSYFFKATTPISTSQISPVCKYVSASLPAQIKIKRHQTNTNPVMDDMYKRFAKKYSMSTSQIKYCLESKYKPRL